MKIKEMIYPSDINDAYEQLISRKKATLMGGGMFLRLQHRTIPFVIDLSNLGLNDIEITSTGFTIGAMVTLRQIETNASIPDGLKACVRQIAGVAMRNMATIGGSVVGRYPFSDVLTALVSLNATLTFHKKGVVPIAQFADNGLDAPDILVSITVPKVKNSLFAAYKPVYTDFSLVNLSISKADTYTISMGATPKHAKSVTIEVLSDSRAVLDQFDFKTDQRASGQYRRALAKALLEDAFEEAKLWK
jgi:CO/xanthine dehydrogenase FAD-binding subunit